MSKVFDFREQLQAGTRHEELFLKNYHSPIVLELSHDYDFRRVSDGKKIELKSDDYNPLKTPNFFIEVWSDFEKKKPGSVWQSLEKKVDIFVYYFPRANLYYEFDLKKLVKELQPKADKYNERGGFIFVRNKGWVSAGFTIKRDQLSHLYTEYTFTPKE